MPSQIVVEIASGHPVEALYAALPSVAVRIDVLHMKRRASYTHALGEIDWLMRDAAILGVALIDRRSVDAQHGFALQTMADRVIDGAMVDRLQCVGQRMTLSISHDQHPDFVVGITAFTRLLGPPPRWRGGRSSDRRESIFEQPVGVRRPSMHHSASLLMSYGRKCSIFWTALPLRFMRTKWRVRSFRKDNSILVIFVSTSEISLTRMITRCCFHEPAISHRIRSLH